MRSNPPPPRSVADGQPQQVALQDVDVVEFAEVRARRFDGAAEIERDDLTRAELGGEVRVAAGAAAGVEHALPSEERAVDGIEPVEELLLELGVELGEVLPLPAERRRRLPLLLHEVGRDEPRDAVPNRPVTTAAVADEPAGLDLDLVRRLEPERVTRQRADELLDEARLHLRLGIAVDNWPTPARGRSSTQRRCQSWKTRSVQSCLR